MPPLYQSPFPKGRLRTVYENVVNQYLQDPQLRAAGVAVNYWSGDPDQQKDIVWQALPALAITPDDGDMAWTDEQRIEGPWRIMLEYGVRGTCAADLMDLAEAVKNAFLWDASRQQLFEPDVQHITFSSLGLKPVPIAGWAGIMATSYLTLSLNLTLDP
jgi:hypothetical protein